MDMYRWVAIDSLGWIEEYFGSSHSIPPPPRRGRRTHSPPDSIRSLHTAAVSRLRTPRPLPSGRLVASLLEPAEARVLLRVHQVDCPHGQLRKAMRPSQRASQRMNVGDVHSRLRSASAHRQGV